MHMHDAFGPTSTSNSRINTNRNLSRGNKNRTAQMGNSCRKAEEKFKRMGLAEVYAGKAGEYEDNENFKEVNIGQDFSVLVAKIAGKFHCIGARCPHAGGPLGQGVYEDGRIYCPWHGSCYDFESGDIEEFPGLDCVPKYPASTRNGKVYVYVNTNNIQMQLTKPMSKLTDYTTRMAIVGGGAAGYMCAQTLRQEGYEGMITMFTKEPYLPYDRTKLSKVLGCKWNDIKLRGKDFYLDNDIEVRLNTTVEHINFFEHKIYTIGSSDYIPYDELFIAVGNRPNDNTDPNRGFNLKNIVTLHDLEDAKHIASHITGRKLLIVGSSFLAMELVTMLKDVCLSIDILSRQKCPYRAILGGEVGALLLKYLKSKDGQNKITFHESNDVKSFKGNANGEVSSCLTINKQEISCDFVILANGVTPNTEQFTDSKLHLDKLTGAIVVNKFLETNLKHTFAGGDCCRFPLSCAAQNSAVVEHWQVALTHGRVAALNMMNEEQKIAINDIVPFYWTVCGDLVVKYCGHGQSYNEILIFGSNEEKDEPEFCAIYRRGIKIVAACAVNCDPLIVQISVAMQNQPEWESEFPECLTKRFPEEPIKLSSGFGIRPDLEHDLLRSDLEIAFFQALSYDRVEKPPEPFVPLKSTLLDNLDDVDVKPKGPLAQSEEDRLAWIRKNEEKEGMEVTLGMDIKLPITEFGEDEGIPIAPQNYVNTKEYLSMVDKKHWPTPAQLLKSAAEEKKGKEVGARASQSKGKPRIDSVPRFLKSEAAAATAAAPPPIKIKITMPEFHHAPAHVEQVAPHEAGLLELPTQHVPAKKNISPTPSLQQLKGATSQEMLARKESPRSAKLQGMVHGEVPTRKMSFRSELAGITGKPHFSARAVRSAPSLTAIPAADTEAAAQAKSNRVGTISEFPEREPIVDPFEDSGTPKKILIPQSLTPSVENELHMGLPDFLKPVGKRKSHLGKGKGLPAAEENHEYLHEKPNYKRLANKDTTPVAKLIMKQYPEIARARAHLNPNMPILETYPPHSTMTPLLTKTPSKTLKEDIEKQGHHHHHHGLSVNNPHFTFTKRINYDFEK